MRWCELRSNVEDLLESRNLKEPRVRLRALDNLEEVLIAHFPNIVIEPSLMLGYEKKDFKKMLSKHKDNGKLNDAESSIVNNFYQLLSKLRPGAMLRLLRA